MLSIQHSFQDKYREDHNSNANQSSSESLLLKVLQTSPHLCEFWRRELLVHAFLSLSHAVHLLLQLFVALGFCPPSSVCLRCAAAGRFILFDLL